MIHKRGDRHAKASQDMLMTYITHLSLLKRFIARFFARPQDIDDIAQEAYLRAFEAEREGDNVHSPKAFLFRIAKNIALNELARKSRSLTGYIDESAAEDVRDKSPTVEQQVIGQEKLALFCQAATSLPLQCRKTFLMRKVYGMSHKEIAERLGISTSTVEKHIAAGLLRCSTFMRDGGYPVAVVSMDVERPLAKQGYE